MLAPETIALIHKNGIKVYPILNRYRKFAVCIEDTFNVVYKRTKSRGDYKHTTDTINQAIETAIERVATLINKKVTNNSK